MALPDRQQKPVRLTSDQVTRLERARHHRGMTQQAFQLFAILRAIEDTEKEMDQARDRKQRYSESTPGPRGGADPAGLGLRPRRPLLAEAAPAADPVLPGQVVVNVGGPGGSEDTILRLAAYVASGPEVGRPGRLRAACAILTASSKHEDERRSLGKQLDAAIAVRLNESASAGSALRRAAGATYDLLKDTLK